MTTTKWIILDMDNTLIDTEPLYNQAARRFGMLMHGLGYDANEVLKRQDAIDAGLFEEFGYSTDRYAESFERTVREFMVGEIIRPVDEVVQDARQFAMDIFDQTATEYPYARDVVRKFLHAGYNVAVITAGERWVQVKRFDDLSMRNIFHDCWVVLKKTSEVFEDFCMKHDVDKSQSWMIGDSIRSDILSSTGAGLNAIHLNTSNWGTTEVGRDRMPSHVQSVPDLSHAPDIILGVTHG